MRKNKFVIVGVESTGKSTCALAVAAHFNTLPVTEYARDYLEAHGNIYNYDDFIKIAKGQLDSEIKSEEASEDTILIFDTDFIVINIWAKIVFDRVESWLSDRLKVYSDRVYFLMSPEVEWINDGLREYPDLNVRKDIHQKYINLLEEHNLRYYLIEGNNFEMRQNTVFEIIKGLI